MLSLILAVPDALREKANRLACALGHDALPGRTFDKVRLSADGQEPASHRACHTWVQPVFVEIIAAAGHGVLPEIEWADFGLTVEDVAEVVGALIVSEPQVEMRDFDAWAAGHGLQRIFENQPTEFL